MEFTATRKRAIKDGTEYDHLFPEAQLTQPVLKGDGDVRDTVHFMMDIVAKDYKDTSKIAKKLKGKTLYETCKNIFDFTYNYIQYEKDKHGVEQLRRPVRTWHDRKKGVDCDCFSIFIGSILYNLGIPFKFRIAKYGKSDSFQHVYVIVPTEKDKSKYYVIDPVLDSFNSEKLYSKKKDYNMKTIHGIPIQYLNGLDGADVAEMVDVIVGTDLQGIEKGLGTVEEQDRSMLNYLKKTRKIIAQSPETVSEVQNPGQMLEMFDYAIKYWNTDRREEALENLERKEAELIEKGLIILSGVDDEDMWEDEWEQDEQFTGNEEEVPYYEYRYEDVKDELGRLFRRRKKRIRKTSKYAAEIEHIQGQLVKCYNDMGETVRIEIDNKILEKYREIAGSEKIMLSITYIKQYINLHGKKDVMEKAKRLFEKLHKAVEKEKILKSDPYADELNIIYNSLQEYIEGNTESPTIQKAELNGLMGIAGSDNKKKSSARKKQTKTSLKVKNQKE